MRSIAEIDRDHEGMGRACVRHSHGCNYPACECDRSKRIVPNVRGIGGPGLGDTCVHNDDEQHCPLCERHAQQLAHGVMARRVLDASDPFCPKCGHNRDRSSVSSIDLADGRKGCQNCGAEWSEPAAGVPACVGIDVALALPGVERLREWAAIGPVQRAAVEAFAACVAPRDEAEKLDALRQTLEIIAVGDSHHPKADADAALRATGFWRAATHGVMGTLPPSELENPRAMEEIKRDVADMRERLAAGEAPARGLQCHFCTRTNDTAPICVTEEAAKSCPNGRGGHQGGQHD